MQRDTHFCLHGWVGSLSPEVSLRKTLSEILKGDSGVVNDTVLAAENFDGGITIEQAAHVLVQQIRENVTRLGLFHVAKTDGHSRKDGTNRKLEFL